MSSLSRRHQTVRYAAIAVAGVAALAAASLVLPSYASTVGTAPNNGSTAIDAAAASTVFGSNVDGSSGETFAVALARQDTEYAPKMLRIFWSGLPSTNCADPHNAQTRPIVTSFKADPTALKAGTYNATLNAWLSCFKRPTRVVYYHEPEDNFTTAAQKTAYRAGWDVFVTLVQAHPNHGNLIPVEILSDYDFKAGRNWKDWYSPRVSELWWDLYEFNENDSNASNDQLMAQHQAARPSLAASRSVGKPFGIGELGYNKPSNRPAFLKDAAAWARTNKVTAVLYFDAIGALGDHRLRDTASQQAWRAAAAG